MNLQDLSINLQPDSFGAMLTPFMNQAWFWIKIIFYFAIFVFACVLFYKLFLQYNIPVTIKKRLGGGGTEIIRDRAMKVLDKQGKLKLKFFRTRKGKKPVTCPVPEACFKQKMGKHDYYEFWVDDNCQAHPILASIVNSFSIKGEKEDAKAISAPEVNETDLKLKVVPQERNAWARSEDKIIEEMVKHKDFLEKWMPTGILLMAMVTAFLIWFFAAKELGSGLNNMAEKCFSVCGQVMGGK